MENNIDDEEYYLPDFTEETFPKDMYFHVDERLLQHYDPWLPDVNEEKSSSFKRFVGGKISPFLALYKVSGHKLTFTSRVKFQAIKWLLLFAYLICLPFIAAYNLIRRKK